MTFTQSALRLLIDLLKVALIAAGGVFAYAGTFQLLVMMGQLSADMDGDGFGRVLTGQAVMVWLVAIIVALAGLFIQAGWRWPLTLAPLYAPALFLLIRAIS